MAKNQDLGFAPNYMSALEIDTTPDAASPTWAIFSRGITEVKPTTNETTEIYTSLFVGSVRCV